MKTITTDQLLALLKLTNFNGTTFVSFDSLTDVSLSGGKKNEMQGRIQKITEKSNVIIFQNKKVNGYENMVRRRLIKEGKNPDSFKLGSRVWGTRIENTPLVEYKGNHYLEVIFNRCGTVEYLFDGRPINKCNIEGLKDTRPGGQGGLDDQVIVRTYKLISITKLTINKETYLIDNK